jgi:hypothetical protein
MTEEKKAQPEAQSVPEKQATATSPTKEKKKKSPWLWVAIGCGGCVLCILLIVGGILALGGFAYMTVKDEVASATNPLCSIEDASDMREAYEEFMTEDYQDNNSYASFKNMLEENEEVFTHCDLIVPDWKDLISGFSASTNEDGTLMSFSKTIEGKDVDVELLVESDGGVKLNDLDVD